MTLPDPVTALLDVPLVLAGHGPGLPGAPREPTGPVEDDRAIGLVPIVVVAVLLLVTVALLVWMSTPATRARLRALVPKAMVVGVIALPLAAWPVLAGGDEDDADGETELIVERAKTRTGALELVVSLDDEELNRLGTTKGRRAVRLECFRADGTLLLAERHRWPFVDEVGFDAPHAHQRVTAREQDEAARCRLRGTTVRLEAAVGGD